MVAPPLSVLESSDFACARVPDDPKKFAQVQVSFAVTFVQVIPGLAADPGHTVVIAV